MVKRPVVVYGAGGMAQWVCAELALCGGDIEVAGFVADDIPRDSHTFLGLSISSFTSAQEDYPPSEFEMLVLTGYRRMRDRRVTFARAKEKGYRVCSFVSPRALTYPDLLIGENVVIGPGTHVGPGCRIGTNAIMCQCVHVGSGAEVGAHSYVAARAVIGGAARIGELCFVGMSATIPDRAKIAEETFVAAGAVVGRSTAPFSQYAGNPARKRGEHRELGMIFFG